MEEVRIINGKQFTEAQLRALTLTDLTELYNRSVADDKQIKLFKDKPTGVARLWNIGKSAAAPTAGGRDKVARRSTPVAARTPAAPAPAASKGSKKARFSAESVIRLLVKENPKKPGKKNYERFAKLRDGMTVGQALEAGVTRGDIIYDVEHGFISVED